MLSDSILPDDVRTTRRSIVKRGAALAYTAPVVAASLHLSQQGALAAISPGILGSNTVVVAPSGWTDTGVDVPTGATVEIADLSGLIYTSDGPNDFFTAAGAPSCVADGSGSLLPGALCNSLVGRIGGSTFAVGLHGTVTGLPAGRLELASNDDFFADNRGTWTISVVIA
jgi:hypothetical protein